MIRFDIINKIGDRFHVGNTENGEFSYSQALKSVGKDIKDYQKATSGTQHQYLDIRFENDRLAILVETKNKFSRWDKAKIQGQLQDYVRFEKANKETFFGYYKDDKFIKRKGLGRVERTDVRGNSLWNKTEEIWLDLYKNKKVIPGLSVMHRVSWKDEWLAEAYMETDYSTLGAEDFQKTINDYLSYLVKEGHIYEA